MEKYAPSGKKNAAAMIGQKIIIKLFHTVSNEL
jgi:hypothetical protein